MNITFAIITGGGEDARINAIIDTIEDNAIPVYEVLIVGGLTSTVERANTRHLPFDEEQPLRSWITRKKNLATQEAANEIVVYLHDYHGFAPDWFLGMLAGGDDFDVQMNAIKSFSGQRFMDWALYDMPGYPPHAYVDYARTDLVRFQYISGGYWVAKRSFMLVNTLDERLASFDAEDVEWSRRIRDHAKIVMNPRAEVRHLKVHRDAHLCAYRARPMGCSL